MLNDVGLQDTGFNIFAINLASLMRHHFRPIRGTTYSLVYFDEELTNLPHPQGKTMNWNKPFETKSGMKARLLGVLAKTDGTKFTHIVAVREGSQECLKTYDSLGKHSTLQCDVLDLINPPTEVSTREAFAHVYELADGTHRLGNFVYATKLEAVDGYVALQGAWVTSGDGRYTRYIEPGKHLGVTKLNTRVKIEE